jgi:hypothetical protein
VQDLWWQCVTGMGKSLQVLRFTPAKHDSTEASKLIYIHIYKHIPKEAIFKGKFIRYWFIINP